MIGERENIQDNTNYGLLKMHHYVIYGNDIDAFYDSNDDLIFVLDNTISSVKPNILLVINSDGDKKWDDILSSKYSVDLETIRPKQDNKYQKLDIEYSGLSVYDGLINAYNAGDGLDDYLTQLDILRDSAARHSAMTRLNLANDIIAKTNTTIVKTKETIVKLQERIKTLRAKLSATKKEIGKVATKQSASKILKIESQIDATNEKLKRAKKRLESAQRRLETATVDAELASNVLNQPVAEVRSTAKSKPVIVAPKYEVQTIQAEDEEPEDDENEYQEEDDKDNQNEVKPLFDKDPEILNEDIAFKPISFDTSLQESDNTPVFNSITFDNAQDVQEEIQEETKPEETIIAEKPVLESITRIQEPEPTNEQPIIFQVPEDKDTYSVLDSMRPIEQKEEFSAPILDENIKEQETILQPIPKTNIPEHIAEPTFNQTPEYTEQTEENSTTNIVPPAPVVSPVATPVTNTLNTTVVEPSDRKKPSVIYYILLVVLILLSIFTLWLYQKNIDNDTAPILTTSTQETIAVQEQKNEEPIAKITPKTVEPVAITDDSEEDIFLDEDTEPANQTTNQETVSEPEPILEETESDEDTIQQETTAVQPEPVIQEDVSIEQEIEPDVIGPAITEEDVIASKPVYTPGQKYDDMFIQNDDYAPDNEVYEEPSYRNDNFIDSDDLSFDEEEAAYQAEQNEIY